MPLIQTTLFMRYVGQGWDIPVEIAQAGDLHPDHLAQRFEAAYARFFSRPIEGLEIEIVSWSVKATLPVTPVARIDLAVPGAVLQPALTRDVFDAVMRRFVASGIFERSRLTVGDRVEGPAIIVEPETSTVITASFVAMVARDGSLIVSRRKGQT